MNAGNRNLAAFGFRVETLNKLKETRSTQKKCAHRTSWSSHMQSTQSDSHVASHTLILSRSPCRSVTMSPRLKPAPSPSRNENLLHFVARELARKRPDGRVAMAASLPHCAAAARLALPATRQELTELRQGLRDGAAVAAAILEDDTDNACFREVQQPSCNNFTSASSDNAGVQTPNKPSTPTNLDMIPSGSNDRGLPGLIL